MGVRWLFPDLGPDSGCVVDRSIMQQRMAAARAATAASKVRPLGQQRAASHASSLARANRLRVALLDAETEAQQHLSELSYL